MRIALRVLGTEVLAFEFGPEETVEEEAGEITMVHAGFAPPEQLPFREPGRDFEE